MSALILIFVPTYCGEVGEVTIFLIVNAFTLIGLNVFVRVLPSASVTLANTVISPPFFA